MLYLTNKINFGDVIRMKPLKPVGVKLRRGIYIGWLGRIKENQYRQKNIKMSEENNLVVLNRGEKNETQLLAVENGLLGFLEQHDLPTNNIFAPVPERATVFKNIEDVIDKIEIPNREDSVYISKFVAAIATGLFDAGLNYLWDETILQIRKRVIQYDLEYFYDNAVTGEKRKKLETEDDIVKLDDYDLIKGAKEIGLISNLGFKHLEYINYMRNWASAAHPNQNELTGLQLVGWLETCIKEVISLPISNIAVRIKQLLTGVRLNEISEKDAEEISVFFTNLTTEQANNLASGFWGIYTNSSTEQKSRQNIILLLPELWGHVSEDTKDGLGIKYGNFVANNYLEEKKLAREYLRIVNAESYIPDDLRGVEIESAINDLLVAHRGGNNFYSEPSFARQLIRIVGESPKVPKQINKQYVYALIEVFMTNANGIAWNAEPTYIKLIQNFDETQATIAMLSFTTTEISSKLQFHLCRKKFLSIVEFAKKRITKPVILELAEKIQDFPESNLENLMKDKRIQTILESIKVLWK